MTTMALLREHVAVGRMPLWKALLWKRQLKAIQALPEARR